MRVAISILGVAICCLAIVAGAVAWSNGRHIPKTTANATESAQAVVPLDSAGPEPTFPDPSAPGTAKTVFIGHYNFDNGVFVTAAEFTGTPANILSLDELGQAIGGRGLRGLPVLSERARRLVLGSPPSAEEATRAIRTWRDLAFLEMYEGRFAEAKSWLARGLDISRTPGVLPLDRAYLRALLGIVALRRGELENCLECVGPSSCIFPIEADAIHQNQSGSREAIEHFSAYLEEWPGDLRIRWLLNLAYMTVGEYPQKVPAAYRIPLDRYRSSDHSRPIPERGEAGRIDCAGPDDGRGQHFRRLHGRRASGPVHDLAGSRPGGVAVRQSGKWAVRRPRSVGRIGQADLCVQPLSRRF